jgi:hypothetical protein
LGTTAASRSNQKFDSAVSTAPLPGIGSGSTTSKADRRSVVTISRRSSPTAYTSRTLPRWASGRLVRFDSNSAAVGISREV